MTKLPAPSAVAPEEANAGRGAASVTHFQDEERTALLGGSGRSRDKPSDKGALDSCQVATRGDQKIDRMRTQHREYLKKLHRLERLYTRLRTVRCLLSVAWAFTLSALLVSALVLFLLVLWDRAAFYQLVLPACSLVKAFGGAVLATALLGTFASVALFLVFKVGTILFFVPLYLQSILLAALLAAVCAHPLNLVNSLLGCSTDVQLPLNTAVSCLFLACALLLNGILADTPHFFVWILLPLLLVTQVFVLMFRSPRPHGGRASHCFLSVLESSPSWIAFLVLLGLHASRAAVYYTALHQKRISFFRPPDTQIIQCPPPSLLPSNSLDSSETHFAVETHPPEVTNEVPGKRTGPPVPRSSPNLSGPATATAAACSAGLTAPSNEKANSEPRTCRENEGTSDQQTRHLFGKYNAFAQQNLWRHGVTAGGCALIVAGIISLSVHFARHTPSTSVPPNRSSLQDVTHPSETGDIESFLETLQTHAALSSVEERTAQPCARKKQAMTPSDQVLETLRLTSSFAEHHRRRSSHVTADAQANVLNVRGLSQSLSAKISDVVPTQFTPKLRWHQMPRRNRERRDSAARNDPSEGYLHEAPVTAFAFLARSPYPSVNEKFPLYPGNDSREVTTKGIERFATYGISFLGSGSTSPHDFGKPGRDSTLLLCGLIFLGSGAALASVQLVWLLACWIDNLLFATMAPINRNLPCVLKTPDMPLPPGKPKLGPAGPLISKLLQTDTEARELRKSEETLSVDPGLETDSEVQASSADADSWLESSESTDDFGITEWEQEMDKEHVQKLGLGEGDKGTGLEG
ncbi:putative transmembrane protein [Toxoplasma gondii GAB2-2007-GAL-DOM2]|uniref:Putative transmembrane protein n=3 Tax=Toxoplasma gondii TaxID=5811 RepID=A0A086LGU0_TOXGO|nr:putative transmembrane protein [Toxoplasma gondii GAB2-2007-GAL-DOM2]KFG55858.1 putative transmembrane protein [Toxoplasma gondii FOU]PUA91880.1 putative transmembrane protein [Toxoplasma gondii TgCATBr9]